ncbi:MAG TPA: plastocyanin/azurin family copper-binding protein, partial [Acidimicrobiia bacterium]|nr:plastocyanin/azurin family copper-binding protein [Acidimicrobiia bacterium]
MPRLLSRRARRALAAGGLAAAALTACGGASHTGQAPAEAEAVAAAPVAADAVTIDNFAFAPMAITVKAGTAVTWTNRDEEPHSVVSSDEPMHSGTLAGQNNTFS